MPDAQAILLNIDGQGNLASVLNKDANAFQHLKSSAQDASAASASGIGHVKDQTVSTTQSIGRLGEASALTWGMTSSQINTARGAAYDFHSVLENTSHSITGGLTPAMMGIPTQHLEQLGMSMDGVSSKTIGADTKLKGLAATGRTTFGSLRSGAGSFIDSMSGVDGAIGGVIAGFGAMQIASMMFGGAMQKEQNIAALSLKFGSEQAHNYADEIQRIVTAVPGDDTFMGVLLSGALAKSTQGLSGEQMTILGNVSAEYLARSTVAGKNMAEVQRDVKDYIMTGATGQLAIDSILKDQLDTLEGKATVEERIAAMEEAMRNEGYVGLAQQQTVANLWEIVKGEVQATATTLGMDILPTVSGILKFILDLDEQTGGWSTKLILVGGLVTGIVGSLGLISSVLKPGVQLFSDMYDGAKRVLGKVTDINNTPCTPKVCETKYTQTGSGTPGTGTPGTHTSTGGGGHLSLLGLLSEIGQGTAIGLTAGDILSNWGIGPVFSGISGLLGGGTPFKAYHGILDVLGLGNVDYSVLNYNDMVKRRAIAEGSITGDQIQKNLRDWGPFDPNNWPKMPEGIVSPFPKLPSGQDLLSWLPQVGKGIGGYGGILDAMKGGIKTPDLGKGILGLFSPGVAAAAGPGQGKPSMQEDLKNLFDFSRFGIKLPSAAPVTNFFGNMMKKGEQTVRNGINDITGFFGGLPGRIIGFGGQLYNSAVHDGQQIVNGVITDVKNLPGDVYNEFMRIGQSILSAGGQLWQWAYDTGTQIVNGLKSALGIASPGLMYHMVRGELVGINTLFFDYHGVLGRASSNLGDQITASFGKGHTTSNARIIGSGGGEIHHHTHHHTWEVNIDGMGIRDQYELQAVFTQMLERMNKARIPSTKPKEEEE